jgi:hypothetical protein
MRSDDHRGSMSIVMSKCFHQRLVLKSMFVFLSMPKGVIVILCYH